MFQRGRHQGIQVLHRGGFKAEFVKLCKEAVGVIINNPDLNWEKCQTVDVDSLDEQISIYYDETDKEFYITNSVILQEYSDSPLEAIVFYEDKTNIFVKDRLISLSSTKISENCNSLSFFSNCHGANNEIVETSVGSVLDELDSDDGGADALNEINDEPPKKRSKRKVYVEMRHLTTKSMESGISEELGLVTYEDGEEEENFGDNMSDCVVRTEMSALESSASIINLHNHRKVTATQEDQRILRQLEIEQLREKCEELFRTKHFGSMEHLIPSSRITIPKAVSGEDEMVQAMSKEIQENNLIYSVDPIIVLKSGDKYEVVSGTRRVQALKQCNKETVPAVTISLKESKLFNLQAFFPKLKSEDVDIQSIISWVGLLLECMGLSESKLTSLNSKEMSTVFCQYLGKDTKVYRTLKMCQVPELREAITFQSSRGIHFGSQMISEIISKHRRNPKQAIDILRCSNFTTEKELREKLNKVEPDTKFMLAKKGLEDGVVNELIETFGSDPQFHAFVRKSDLRSMGKNAFESVSRRFSTFKSKLVTHTPDNISQFFEVLKLSDEIPFFLCFNEKTAITILSKNDTTVGLLFGMNVVISSQSSFVVIPDDFATIDTDGCLLNMKQISLFVKKEGKMLEGSELTQYFQGLGMNNKKIMDFDSVSKLFPVDSQVFLDFVDQSGLDIGLYLLKKCEKVAVKNELSKKLITRCAAQNKIANNI